MNGSGMKRRGALLVVSAPSGAGKTSLVRSLVASMPDVVISVSHTTRAPREGERDGIDYHFVDEQTFSRMMAEDRFLEHASVFDYHYGTSRAWVDEHRDGGQDVILEIDWQGARQVKANEPGATGIFILPPSLAELQARLRRRGTDEQNVIERRVREAAREIAHFAEYDFLVVNDDFHTALADLHSIVRCIRLRREVQVGRLRSMLDELLPESQVP